MFTERGRGLPGIAAGKHSCEADAAGDMYGTLIAVALEISRQELELKARIREAIEQNDLEKVLEIARQLTGLA